MAKRAGSGRLKPPTKEQLLARARKAHLSKLRAVVSLGSSRRGSVASGNSKKDIRLDNSGRVRKGSRIDISATSEYYKGYYDDIFINSDPKVRRKYLLDFVKYFNKQVDTGRSPSRVRNISDIAFAGRFGVHPPAGSKVVFLPNKYANKKISYSAKGVPSIRGKNAVSKLYFLDFVTDEWLDELEELEDADPEDLRAAIEAEVGKFIRRLPDDGALFAIVLATGDLAKGSTHGKRALGEVLVDLIYRVIKSKSSQELKDFIVAVEAIYPIKKPRNRKRSKAKGKL